ncbi:MAG: PAS domain S-box protein, partial [Chloroflexi bacterium]|nr:PAS domain S-box protein [Chloroflexota bacterium]
TDLCQERRGPFQLEVRFRDPSGGLTPTRATVSRIPGDGGQATAIWMVENVAERKRAEEAVRESERRFRLLVERAADAVFLHDMQGAIVDVNQQACESLGYTRDELLKLAVRDIEAAVPEDAQRGLWRSLTAGAPQTLQGAHRRKDGSVFPVELRIGSFDIDGRPYILSLARDVTERQRAEAALRETTEMLQALVQAAPVGVTVFDLDGRMRLWNPAAERIFRISAERILDRGLEALRDLQPDNVPAFSEVIQEVLQGRPVSDVEVVAVRSDGVPVDVAISAAPLSDSGGRIRALMGVLEDVTERKRAEAAIQRHSRELAVLYETSLDVARRSNVLDILQVIVDRAARLMGAEMGGIYLMRDDRPELELVVIHNLAPEYRGVRLALGEGLSGKVAQTGEPQAVTNYAAWEGRAAAYEGAVFRRVAAAPLKRAGKVIGVINVTDNMRTDPFEADELRVLQLFADQAAIALENARLFEETRRRAAHLEAITSVAAALRAAGRRDQMMSVILARLQELLGAHGALLALEDRATREIVVPQASGTWSAMTGVLPPGATGIFADVMAGGRPTWDVGPGTEAWESLPPSVRELPVVALVPLVEQEKVVGLFGVGRQEPFGDAERSLLLALAEVVGSALHRADVLETLEQRVQVRTRELAEANERLTELDRLKSNFVSNVSHELRTPITNVLLYLDLLQQPGREERRPTYLQVLRHESERLGHLIEDLLTLSRVDQEAVKISRELRSLDPLLGEVAAAHRARAQAKGVALTLEPNPEVPPAWMGYQPMIQVFNNLVANAVAYTQPGGSVTLGSLVRRSAQGETEVGARVWNGGPPIPPEDIPQLFQRFFRGRTGRESGEPGTGLGLSICKEIVDRHGGWIDVVSSEDQGTSFTVWLPIGVEG